MTDANKRSLVKQKALIKERIRLSNEAVKNGLPPDPWVVEFRIKNNMSKANWKARQPKKEHKPKRKPKKQFTEEESRLRRNASNRLYYQKKKALGIPLWSAVNKERTNEYKRNKRATDHSFRMACNLRKRLSFVLKSFAAKKSQQTLSLLGCTMAEFMVHLEKQFKPGMSFDNYGKWHIDHKIPCALFDLTKPEQQAICFHHTNLQPLWAVDNLVKNKYTLTV